MANSPDLLREYTFTVNATGPFGPVEPMIYLVDLAVILSTVLNTETAEAHLKEIAEQLKELADAVEQLMPERD